MASVRLVWVTGPDARKARVNVDYDDGSIQVILADQLLMPSPSDPAAAKVQIADQLKTLTVAPQGIEPDQISIDWRPRKA